MEWLPEQLPTSPQFAWETKLTNQGLGGLTATSEVVLVCDRDPADLTDVFRCLDAATGRERWVISYPAPGNLDYGNSPRAAPLIVGKLVYLHGAFGQLSCVQIDTGEIVWRRDLRSEFLTTERLVWGHAASPLEVDGKLIVFPGGAIASVAALDLKTGDTVWATPGGPPAFASPIVATLGGRRQIVGYDKTSLGGWDVADGRRLWSLEPPRNDDFNVPTPVAVDGRLLVATENNGTRLYDFDAQGRIAATPTAHFDDLAPDTHTPVVTNRRVFGIWSGLYCLNLDDGLKLIYTADDDAFHEYATLIASNDRILATTLRGEILLFEARSDNFRLINRLKLFDDESGVYAHPAIVGNRLYVRASDRIVCLEL